MKTLSLVYKILPIALLFFISILPVQALSFPNGQPTGGISWWKFNQILTNIFGDCWVGNYIQWFTSTGVVDCKSVASFNTLTLTVWHPNTTPWSWLFQKYFTKILNDCGTGRYVRWFDSNKNLICEDIAKIVTIMGTTTLLVSPVTTVIFPSSPAWQIPGGTFTDSFNTLFAADCWVGKYLQWFDSGKNKICGSIVTTIAITNCTELQNIGTNATTLSGNYHLTNNIDCSATSLSWNPLNHGWLGFDPIWTYFTRFTGVLDWKWYKIIWLFINRPTILETWLFGHSSGTLKNLWLDWANISWNWNVWWLAW